MLTRRLHTRFDITPKMQGYVVDLWDDVTEFGGYGGVFSGCELNQHSG
jgi:hypothetical protein